MLILNEIKVAPEALGMISELWKGSINNELEKKHCLYVSQNDVLEISLLEDEQNVLTNLNKSPLRALEKKITAHLLSDWHSQVLTLRETVKPQSQQLPTTPFLQLRHIEVPLNVYDNYINWRKETIFRYVIDNSKVESFLAYHSLLSTEPGVTFFSGFNCDKDEYLKSFDTPIYQKIIKDAGNQFICGGEKSLFTKIYQRI